MTTQISIDLETLGTNVDSQILSIGACAFDLKTGDILETFYVVVRMEPHKHVKVTPSTLAFWLKQSTEARAAIWATPGVNIMGAFAALNHFIEPLGDVEMWANGTKFDLGMVEYQMSQYSIKPAWPHNADRCMRTLRKFAGYIYVAYEGIPHHALDDAIWQAKYISLACEKLGLTSK